MSGEPGDTADRSLAHWSEARRREMDAFYAVATQDYEELAGAYDWRGELGRRLDASGGALRGLDVACGSGKFPRALAPRLEGLAGALAFDLLDPSPFSVREARRAYDDVAPSGPLRVAEAHTCTLQALPADAGPYDVVWAVHALYALPPREMAEGAAAFARALAPGGLGFVAHATREAHYLRFYDAYLRRREGTPYTDAAAWRAAFADAGLRVEARTIRYTQVVTDLRVAEGFLQRCLFDETLDLAAMRADPDLGPYLGGCEAGDGLRFEQAVDMIWLRR